MNFRLVVTPLTYFSTDFLPPTDKLFYVSFLLVHFILNMASKQHSKFRHLKLTPNKSDRCMQNIICSSGGHSDSTICDVGRSFIAIILEGQSGGSFLVIRLDEYGRIPIDHCKVSGHSKKVLDVKWSPFNDNIVASCSEDSTVKSWYIPENGLTGSHLEDCLVQCNASGKKVFVITIFVFVRSANSISCTYTTDREAF